MENIIDQKKFMACKKQYMIGEDESKEGILSLICLFKWLERHQ